MAEGDSLRGSVAAYGEVLDMSLKAGRVVVVAAFRPLASNAFGDSCVVVIGVR